MNELLSITLHDAIAVLQAEGIAYALIGGLAASVRGSTRVTDDADLAIAADIDQAIALLNKLDRTKFRPLFSGAQEVVERSFVLPMVHQETAIKVDLSLGLSGFEQQAIARATPVDMGGLPVAVATAEDLLIMKALAGRPQDDQDARGILIVQRKHLDWKYCERVAAELGESMGVDLAERIQILRASVR